MNSRKLLISEKMKIIDAHIHLKPSDKAPVSSLLRQLDTYGIEKAMLILNVEEEYDALIKDIVSFKASCDRFWIAVGINIHDENSFARFDELRQLGIEPKVKIHPHLFKIRREEIGDVVKSVEPYDTQIIVDSLYYGEEIEYHNGVEVGLAIARQYPNRKVVMAHSGSVEFLKCMMLTRYLPNVYYDYSFIQTFFQNTSLRLDMVNFLSRTANRIMFGSDYPSFSIESALDNMKSLVEEAGLKDKQIEMVFAQNASKVYGYGE